MKSVVFPTLPRSAWFPPNFRAATWLVLAWLAGWPAWAGDAPGADATPEPGLTYMHERTADVPWSIHIVRMDRSEAGLEIRSAHAHGGALELGTLSDQVKLVNPTTGVPLAAVNGDFYQRDGAYAGDPRGLQIVEGELLSAPNGGVSFWIDPLGQPHTAPVTSQFQITWPDGTTTPFDLNGDRRGDRVELYTPSAGASTHTTGGVELVLEPQNGSAWLPLRIGRTYQARVREVREAGNTSVEPDVMILSIGSAARAKLPRVEAGAVLSLSTASAPVLRGVRTAIGGGPVLARNGRRQKIVKPGTDAYEFNSMLERHPRSAVGWNQKFFYFVEVDGRQKNLSVGMTLDELSAYLVKLGCEEAMTLDGGGSATLWYRGAVRNSPCDGRERPIANSLLVVRKNAAPKPIVAAGAGPKAEVR